MVIIFSKNKFFVQKIFKKIFRKLKWARWAGQRFSFCLISFFCFAHSETEFYAEFVRKKLFFSYHSIERKKSLSYNSIEW